MRRWRKKLTVRVFVLGRSPTWTSPSRRSSKAAFFRSFTRNLKNTRPLNQSALYSLFPVYALVQHRLLLIEHGEVSIKYRRSELWKKEIGSTNMDLPWRVILYIFWGHFSLYIFVLGMPWIRTNRSSFLSSSSFFLFKILNFSLWGLSGCSLYYYNLIFLLFC